MAISRNGGNARRRQCIRKADIRHPNRNPELKHVRFDVFGRKHRIRVRPRNVPHLKTVLFAAGGNLGKKQIY